jgi:hypothetical protein
VSQLKRHYPSSYRGSRRSGKASTVQERAPSRCCTSCLHCLALPDQEACAMCRVQLKPGEAGTLRAHWSCQSHERLSGLEGGLGIVLLLVHRHLTVGPKEELIHLLL